MSSMTERQFSPWPSFTKEEVAAVERVLLSNKVNYWTGSECLKFEEEFAAFVGCKHAITLANGTVALDLALKSIGLVDGDEVIVTSRTFIGSVSSIVNAGATPIFSDVERDTQNIDANELTKLITKKTRAIVCVHLAGWPCDMDPIMKAAEEHGIFVIEDCAQAHGAKYKGKSVGSIGDVGAWSFCQDKIITTGGEGGMITTNNSDLWSQMWSYKDHGKNWHLLKNQIESLGFRWVHDSFGTNWRMTEMQAAIGRIQLSRISHWNRIRRRNAALIWKASSEAKNLRIPNYCCKGCDGKCDQSYGCVNGAYRCYVFVQGSAELRDRYLKEINKRGVPCFLGSCSEVYLEKAFAPTNFRPEKPLPVANELGQTSLAFLCHPTLSDEEISLTCRTIKDVCS